MFDFIDLNMSDHYNLMYKTDVLISLTAMEEMIYGQ